MAQITKEQIFKYLTGFQLVMALLWWFIQTFGVDSEARLILAVALILLAAYLYAVDRSFKKNLRVENIAPDDQMALFKLMKLIEGLRIIAQVNEDRESTEESGVVEGSTGTTEGTSSGDSPDYTSVG